MILVVLGIGAVLLVSALRNTYGSLFADLGQDVPKFVVWAAAILALGAIGYIPGLKPISRGLMALVLVVIVMQNYSNILTGFQATAKSGQMIKSSDSTSASSAAANSNQTVPNYSELDDLMPGSAFSAASIGQA